MCSVTHDGARIPVSNCGSKTDVRIKQEARYGMTRTNTVTVTHEYTNHGAQVRAYGNHVWDGYVTFTTAWELSEVGLRRAAERYVRFFATPWRDESEPNTMDHYFSPFLVTLEKVPSKTDDYHHRWHYRIEQHYTD
jgi:hypothetical protein